LGTEAAKTASMNLIALLVCRPECLCGWMTFLSLDHRPLDHRLDHRPAFFLA
jgi:hypothetical protein